MPRRLGDAEAGDVHAAALADPFGYWHRLLPARRPSCPGQNGAPIETQQDDAARIGAGATMADPAAAGTQKDALSALSFAQGGQSLPYDQAIMPQRQDRR